MTNDRVRLTKGELEGVLVEQLWLLRDSAGIYFNEWWQPVKGLEVATRVRVLMHHTQGQTKALLEQLGLRGGHYLHAIGNGNTLTAPGIPHPGPRVFLPYAPWDTEHMIPLDQWWTEPGVRYAPNSPIVSRWDLIQIISNQAGGAHVDAELDQDMATLRRYQPHNWQVIQGQDDGEQTMPMMNFEMASVRNIGLELLWTLEHSHGEYIRELRAKSGDTEPPYPRLLPEPGEYDAPA